MTKLRELPNGYATNAEWIHGKREARGPALIVLSEGYKEDDLRIFEDHVDTLMRVIRTEEWFQDYREDLRVARIDVASRQPASWIPYRCPSKPVSTAFEGSFCADGKLMRLFTGKSGYVFDFAESLAGFRAGVDCCLVLVNKPSRGGSGGRSCAWSCVGARWTERALHEVGHSWFGLGDEYEGEGSWSFGEPDSPNLTIETRRDEIKWRHLIPDHVPIPTPESKAVAIDDAGLYEGGGRRERGVYRGCRDCRMRSWTGSFCVVCLDAIARKLTDLREESKTAEPPKPSDPIVVDHPKGPGFADPIRHDLIIIHRDVAEGKTRRESAKVYTASAEGASAAITYLRSKYSI